MSIETLYAANSYEEITAALVELQGETIDMVELQKTIEGVYSKRNIRGLIRAELASDEFLKMAIFSATAFITDLMETDFYEAKNLELAKLKDFDLESMVLDIMTVLMQQDFHTFELTKVVAGCMACTPFGEVILDLKDDTYSRAFIRGIKCTSSILVQMAEAELIDIYPAFNSEFGTVTIGMPFTFDGELAKAIDRAKFLPPMVCPPRVLTKNTDSGYHTFNSHRITKKLQQHDEDICLDVLNLANSTAYTLNLDYLASGCTDSFKFDDEKDMDEAHQRALFEAHQLSTELTTAEVVALGNKFWLEWFLCYRGRMYDRGYEVHIQGTSHKKAMIDFAEPSAIEGWEAYADIFDFTVVEQTVEELLAEIEAEPEVTETVVVEVAKTFAPVSLFGNAPEQIYTGTWEDVVADAEAEETPPWEVEELPIVESAEKPDSMSFDEWCEHLKAMDATPLELVSITDETVAKPIIPLF